MLFGGQVPAFQGTLVPTYQHAESKNPKKEKMAFHNQENLKLYKLY
jgi:hypothetical protein